MSFLDYRPAGTGRGNSYEELSAAIFERNMRPVMRIHKTRGAECRQVHLDTRQAECQGMADVEGVLYDQLLFRRQGMPGPMNPPMSGNDELAYTFIPNRYETLTYLQRALVAELARRKRASPAEYVRAMAALRPGARKLTSLSIAELSTAIMDQPFSEPSIVPREYMGVPVTGGGNMRAAVDLTQEHDFNASFADAPAGSRFIASNQYATERGSAFAAEPESQLTYTSHVDMSQAAAQLSADQVPTQDATAIMTAVARGGLASLSYADIVKMIKLNAENGAPSAEVAEMQGALKPREEREMLECMSLGARQRAERLPSMFTGAASARVSAGGSIAADIA